MELALDGCMLQLHPGRTYVSILVFVELALDDKYRKWYYVRNRVSILVFVELALDDKMMLHITLISCRFNPCFRGTCSWWKIPKQNKCNDMFQSLFSWNLLLMKIQFHVFPPASMFQSLFSWNLLLMGIRHTQQNNNIKFQSLFSWNLLLMCKIYVV